jgi:hypothetical protein
LDNAETFSIRGTAKRVHRAPKTIERMIESGLLAAITITPQRKVVPRSEVLRILGRTE